jgi:hypothetical protein
MLSTMTSHPLTSHQRIPVRHPSTASRVFSGEAVVITPAENTVRMFNPVGSLIWELMDGQQTVGQIVATLVDQFDVAPERAQRTVLDFFALLEEKGLVAWVGE